MGCIPEKKEKNIITSKLEVPEEPNLETSNEKGFKYTEGILVKERNIDPLTLYDELNMLGEGAYGKVVKVRHKVSKVLRAMKIINKDKMSLGSEEEEALINEINVVKSLDHPNIMKVYEFFNKDNSLYIISELLSGGELLDKINEAGSLNEDVSSFLMKQIFSAVDFCHQKGIIHRDLKPENILIESEEEANKEFFTVKIIDFGTSGKLKSGEMFNLTVGTPLYVSPEVLKNKYNEKCDMWSCGVIMYMMLSGNPPFKGDNDEEIYQAVKEGKYNFDDEKWDTISGEAKDLIKNLLIKDMNKRYSAKKALSHPWIAKHRRNKALDKNKLNEVVINLKNYSAKLKLQQLTLAYIVHNLTSKEDCDFLREVFIIFDESGSGKLTKAQLIKGLNIVLSEEESEKEVNRLMNIIDVDGNGFIEYEEFLRAGLDKAKIITKENLETSFKLYDINKRGKINARELGMVLGQGDENIKEEVWQELIDEADIDKDGEINFNDFKTIMEEC
jgi:calcium-dependent protein kinase